uniref:Uncharacterized protein n=1 Tax=uncultured prokaryote TaxID=198431 RepID=A0A0H5Q1D5_9ZZZZ|nr:hypothetical protein [uncultured prokaryote]
MANRWQMVLYGQFAAGEWDGEIATMSFSGTCKDTGGYTPPVINEALPEFAAVPSGGTDTTTHMNVTFGSSGIGAWTEANQKLALELGWTFMDAVDVYQVDDFRWTEVRLSAIEADGSVVNGATVGALTSVIPGTATTLTLPPQTAVVCSHRTGGRGPRNRGRNYLPLHTTGGLTTDALVLAALKTNLNNYTKNFVQGIQAITGWNCAVVSATHQTYSDITAVSVGDEIDTQRRRRNERRETYQTLNL